MQNGLGIVLAGSLGGYVVLQRQGKEKLEEELTGKISSEQQNVQGLKDEVRQVFELQAVSIDALGCKLTVSIHLSWKLRRVGPQQRQEWTKLVSK